jgi:hypothetical protein
MSTACRGTLRCSHNPMDPWIHVPRQCTCIKAIDVMVCRYSTCTAAEHDLLRPVLAISERRGKALLASRDNAHPNKPTQASSVPMTNGSTVTDAGCFGILCVVNQAPSLMNCPCKLSTHMHIYMCTYYGEEHTPDTDSRMACGVYRMACGVWRVEVWRNRQTA